MSAATVTLVVLAIGTYGLKAAGPLVLGGRTLPGLVTRLADLAPAALLAGIVSVSTFSSGSELVLDARAAGVAAAGAALLARLPFVVVIAIAVATTALVRAVG